MLIIINCKYIATMSYCQIPFGTFISEAAFFSIGKILILGLDFPDADGN
jgi:hypothetical protein